MKILIVDDDIVFLDALKALLSAEGFSVQGATTGKRGLEIAEEWLPDLIILDIILPDINGLKVLASIRENKKISDTPVLVCTNEESKKTSDACTSLGAKKVLLKVHHTPGQIIDIIKKAAK